jgi:hypothetical protein
MRVTACWLVFGLHSASKLTIFLLLSPATCGAFLRPAAGTTRRPKLIASLRSSIYS